MLKYQIKAEDHVSEGTHSNMSIHGGNVNRES